MRVTSKFHGNKEASQWKLGGWLVAVVLAVSHKLVRNYGGFISLHRGPESPRSMTQAYTLLTYLTLRLDHVRNRHFRRALRRRGKEKEALEVGPGALGVLTRIGLKAGMRHVMAVESNEAALEVFSKRFSGKRVTPMLGFSTDVRLDTPVDLVFGEIFGSVASSEGALRAFGNARHLLREGGDIIPSVAYTQIVPVQLPPMGRLRRCIHSRWLPFGALPFEEGFYRTYNFPRSCWLSEPQVFEHYDFRTVAQPVQKRSLVFKLKEGARLDGFLLFIGFDLAGDGVDTFTSLQKTSWSNPLIGLGEGVPVGKDKVIQLDVEVDLTQESPSYSIGWRHGDIEGRFAWSGC